MTTIKEYTDAIEVVEEEIEKEVLFKPNPFRSQHKENNYTLI